MSAYGDDSCEMQCPFCDSLRKSKQSKTCGTKACATKQRIQTNITRFGVSNPSQCNDIKQKKVRTTLKNYGVVNPSQSKVIKDKKSDTAFARYGVRHTTQLESKKEKTKITNLAKYGSECSLSSVTVRNKGKRTKLEKYNDENFNNRDRAKRTCLRKYGVAHQMQDAEIKQRTKLTTAQTCLQKYGMSHSEVLRRSCKDKYNVENPMHDPAIAKRCFGHAFRSKDYVMPSGKVVRVQGYEGHAITMLLETYRENDIVTDTAEIPVITYIGLDHKEHKYYPDIFIPKERLIIEVKSSYTYAADLPQNLLKRDASIAEGYEFQFMIIGGTPACRLMAMTGY